MLQTNYQNQTTKIKNFEKKSNHAKIMIIHANAQTDCNCKEIFARKIWRQKTTGNWRQMTMGKHGKCWRNSLLGDRWLRPGARCFA